MKQLKLFLLVWVSIFLWSGITFAAPVPDPPDAIYRIDDRDPDIIFAQGFQPWSSQSQEPDESFVRHITGDSIRSQTSHWVSASGSRGAAENTIADLARQREEFPSTVWLYEIRPTQDSFSVNWAAEEAIEDYHNLPIATPPIVLTLRSYLRAYRLQDEWATRSGLQSRQIRQAVQYRLSEGRWVRTGNVRDNSHFDPLPRPTRQRVNPITQQARLEAMPVYGYEIDWASIGMAVFARWISLGISCEGTPASPNRKTKNGNQYCDKDRVHVVPMTTKEYPSRLHVITHTGDKYCWIPALSAKSSGPYNFVLYLQLQDCGLTKDGFTTYDELGRLVYYWGGFEFCLTAPASVTSGSERWDWITMEPCVTNNPGQVWDIYKGKIYLRGTRQYIQDWKYYAILSKDNSGYDNSLDQSRMSSDFFKYFSRVRSLMSEIGLGWRWKGVIYYPTDNLTQPWGTRYLKRTFYDSLSNKIVMLTAYSRAFQSDFPQAKCLSSRQVRKGSGPWDWTDWQACRQRDDLGKEYKFSINSTSTTFTAPVSVAVKDFGKNVLWSQATGQNAGFFFTATTGDYSSNSTKDFVVNFSAYKTPFFFYNQVK